MSCESTNRESAADAHAGCEETSVDDASLLLSYAGSRSERAFSELVRRYVDLVYSTAVRCVGGDAHLAKDVTQEVFILVEKRAAALASHPAFEGWLYTSTRYEASCIVRRERRRRAREEKAHIMNELVFDSKAEPDWHRLRTLLDEAMGRLSRGDRDAVVLRYFLRRSFREIGGKLGMNEDAARMRVDRALQKLHRLLADRGIASTATALSGLLSAQAVGAAPTGLATSVATAALASSSGTAGIALYLHVIAGSKVAAGVVLVALIGAVTLATHSINARRNVATAHARMSAQGDAVAARLRELELRTNAARDDVPAPTTRTADSAVREAAAAEEQSFLERHPEVKQALINRSNAKLDFRWSRLYQSLGLNSAQIEEFRNLIREGETFNAGIGSDGMPLSFRLGTGLAREEIHRRMTELLGPEGVKTLHEIGRTAPARELIVSLASALCYTDEPLTQRQSEQLIELLVQNQAKSGVLQIGRFDWNAVMAAAPRVLSESQRTSLDGLRAQDLLQVALGGARLTLPNSNAGATQPKQP